MKLCWTLFKYRLGRQKLLYTALILICLLVFIQAGSRYISAGTMLWEGLAVMSFTVYFLMKTREFDKKHKAEVQAIIDKGKR